MPIALKSMVLVTALVWSAGPIFAAGMPDFGTKNFSPGAATPAYFTNENGAGEVEAADDGADAPTGSFDRVASPRHAEGGFRQHHEAQVSRTVDTRAATHARGRFYPGRGVAADRMAAGRRVEHSSHAAARSRPAPLATSGSARSAARHAAARFAPRKG